MLIIDPKTRLAIYGQAHGRDLMKRELLTRYKAAVLKAQSENRSLFSADYWSDEEDLRLTGLRSLAKSDLTFQVIDRLAMTATSEADAVRDKVRVTRLLRAAAKHMTFQSRRELFRKVRMDFRRKRPRFVEELGSGWYSTDLVKLIANYPEPTLKPTRLRDIIIFLRISGLLSVKEHGMKKNLYVKVRQELVDIRVEREHAAEKVTRAKRRALRAASVRSPGLVGVIGVWIAAIFGLGLSDRAVADHAALFEMSMPTMTSLVGSMRISTYEPAPTLTRQREGDGRTPSLNGTRPELLLAERGNTTPYQPIVQARPDWQWQPVKSVGKEQSSYAWLDLDDFDPFDDDEEGSTYEQDRSLLVEEQLESGSLDLFL